MKLAWLCLFAAWSWVPAGAEMTIKVGPSEVITVHGENNGQKFGVTAFEWSGQLPQNPSKQDIFDQYKKQGFNPPPKPVSEGETTWDRQFRGSKDRSYLAVAFRGKSVGQDLLQALRVTFGGRPDLNQFTILESKIFPDPTPREPVTSGPPSTTPPQPPGGEAPVPPASSPPEGASPPPGSLPTSNNATPTADIPNGTIATESPVANPASPSQSTSDVPGGSVIPPTDIDASGPNPTGSGEGDPVPSPTNTSAGSLSGGSTPISLIVGLCLGFTFLFLLGIICFLRIRNRRKRERRRRHVEQSAALARAFGSDKESLPSRSNPEYVFAKRWREHGNGRWSSFNPAKMVSKAWPARAGSRAESRLSLAHSDITESDAASHTGSTYAGHTDRAV